MIERYVDRREAGRILGHRLSWLAGRKDVVVLALPRGGVPVGFEVARILKAPLDVCVVRKLGVPGHAELAMGAIASGGVRVLNDEVVSFLAIPDAAIERVARAETIELERRERAYRDGRPPLDPAGRVAVLVDDGLATGSTMRAAIAAVARGSPARTIVAVPVAAPETVALVRREVDEVVCPLMPPGFAAVGLWYDDFGQTTDEEVRTLLAAAQVPTEQARAG